MSKQSRFRGPIDKQHGKRAQAQFKSPSHNFYRFHRPLSSQVSWKKSVLQTWQIFGLVLNTLAANEKFPVPKRDNLPTPVQMQLSQKH